MTRLSEYTVKRLKSLCMVIGKYIRWPACYDTTGSSGPQESGGACAILGMTLSRVDLVFGRFVWVRSVRQRKVIPLVAL